MSLPPLLPMPARPQKAIRLAQLCDWRTMLHTEIPTLTQEIGRFAKRQVTDLVWVALNDLLLFIIA